MEPSEVHRRIQGLGRSTATLAGRQWRRMRTVDDWPSIADRLTLMVRAGLVASARLSASEAAEALDSAATVSPAAWGRTASDGRPLDSLLYSGVVRARTLYGSGRTDQQILDAGQAWMQQVVLTQVADAGRSASGVITTATKDAGWIRYVSPPCCQRCAVLAGKWFRWNQGFRRHPGCDCVHHPVRGSKVPAGYQQSIADDQIHDLTEAQRQALAEGADRNRVLNAYRGTNSTAERLAMDTTRGRLTPEGIYARAKTREEAVELLRANGYLL